MEFLKEAVRKSKEKRQQNLLLKAKSKGLYVNNKEQYFYMEDKEQERNMFNILFVFYLTLFGIIILIIFPLLFTIQRLLLQ